MQHRTLSDPWTLRRCALPSCWRRFPVPVASGEQFCDEDCRAAFLRLLDVPAPAAAGDGAVPAANAVPAPARNF